MTLVARQSVIEHYIRYDARKKGLAIPLDLSTWNWSSADDLDKRLHAAGFKCGIIAGYIWWKPVELGRSDLSRCAVYQGVFPGLPRMLAQLRGLEAFKTWKPPWETEWYDLLERSGDYPCDWPLILRPAVKCEAPATWYLEDGSGRATCFFRRLVQSSDDTRKAFGYLGVVPDQESTFMCQKFPSLLNHATGAALPKGGADREP